MIKAVIFDMDGLLIDSEPFWRQSHVESLLRHGHKITEEDARAAAGKRTSDQVSLWQERFQFKTPSNSLLTQQIEQGVLQAIKAHGRALPGARELIEELDAHNIPMAVASSSADELIETVLETLAIKKYMQAIHSAEREERGKPFPDVFLSTAKTLGFSPQDCLVFEDSLNGVKAAKAAGMHCIAVPEPPFDRALFKQAGADKIVKSLRDLNWQILQTL